MPFSSKDKDQETRSEKDAGGTKKAGPLRLTFASETAPDETQEAFPTAKKKVQEELEIEFTKLPSETASVEEEWKIFTTTTTSVLHRNCGKKRAGQTKKKGTIWWNNDVKLAVSYKKKCYKTWQKSKAEQDYITYRKARREAKRTIKINLVGF